MPHSEYNVTRLPKMYCKFETVEKGPIRKVKFIIGHNLGCENCEKKKKKAVGWAVIIHIRKVCKFPGSILKVHRRYYLCLHQRARNIER